MMSVSFPDAAVVVVYLTNSVVDHIVIENLVIHLCRNFMITGLQDIEKCRQQLHDINVPLEVFE